MERHPPWVSQGREQSGSVSTLVSTAGLALGVEAVPLLLIASGKWRLPGPLSLKLSISIELQQY